MKLKNNEGDWVFEYIWLIYFSISFNNLFIWWYLSLVDLERIEYVREIMLYRLIIGCGYRLVFFNSSIKIGYR